MGKINEVQPLVCGCKVLNVVVVVCPGINKVVVTFGRVNSVPSGIGRLLIGLLVNGSRSYNLKKQDEFLEKFNF